MNRSRAQISGSLAVFLAATIGVGLYVDQTVEIWGQIAASVCCWAILLYLIHRARGEFRFMLVACLVIATGGELLASLYWGLYTYRLYNVPPFVPPGHVFMLVIALYLAENVSAKILVGAATATAVLYAIYAFRVDVDGLSVVLAACFVPALLLAKQRKLYAATFMLAIPLELYGTWLGNWRWHETVPGFNLSMANPPVCIGAAYCLRDVAVHLFALRNRARSSASRRPASGAIAGATIAQGRG